MLRVAAAYGMDRCQVDVTFTSLTVSWDRDDAVPLTGIRIVRARTQDYTRLQAVTDLAHEIADGSVAVDEAHRRLDAAVSAPHPYQRWVVTLALSGMAAAVGFLLGGGWLVALVAAASTAGVDQLMRQLGRWGLPQFFQQVAGAALATGVAVLMVVLDVPVRTSFVVAAGIVVLLAGLGLVGAAEDAISGFHVTAAARGAEVLTLTAGIVVGIAAVLDLAAPAEGAAVGARPRRADRVGARPDRPLPQRSPAASPSPRTPGPAPRWSPLWPAPSAGPRSKRPPGCRSRPPSPARWRPPSSGSWAR